MWLALMVAAFLAGGRTYLAARRRRPGSAAVLTVLLASPGLALGALAASNGLALAHGDPFWTRDGETLRAGAFAFAWLMIVAIGALLGGRARPWRERRGPLLTALGTGIALAMAAVATSQYQMASVRAAAKTIHDAEMMANWRKAEQTARQCAERFSAASGEATARADLQRGEHRLYERYPGESEVAQDIIPGLSGPATITRTETFPHHMITIHFEGTNRIWRGEVEMGPDNFAYESFSVPLPSAAACTAASLAYVTAYNRVMLGAR